MIRPPSWVCKDLAKFHSWARIGWDPEVKKFALVQLYHSTDAEKTFREKWKNRGPLFSKDGSLENDWDSADRCPVYIIDLEPRQVLSGEVTRLVKRWVRPIASRVHEGVVESAKQNESTAQGLAEQSAEWLHWKGQRDGAGAPVVAKKFVTRSLNQIRDERGDFDLSKKLPQAPPGGWEKHVENDEGDASDLGSL